MKKLFALLLAVLLLAAPATPALAAADVEIVTEEGTADNPYRWNTIPKEWIKAVKKDGRITAYVVTVPDGDKASFWISGTTFQSVRCKKSADGAYAASVELTAGKRKAFKDVAVLRATVREEASAGSDASAVIRFDPAIPFPYSESNFNYVPEKGYWRRKDGNAFILTSRDFPEKKVVSQEPFSLLWEGVAREAARYTFDDGTTVEALTIVGNALSSS